MAKPDAASGGKPGTTPESNNPADQLTAALKSQADLGSRATRATARVKVLQDRVNVEKKLSDFDTWLRDRKIALENDANTLSLLEEATQKASPAKADAIAAAIAKVDDEIASLTTTAQAAHDSAVTSSQDQTAKATALKAAQDANLKAQNTLAGVEAQVKVLDDRLKAAKDELNKPNPDYATVHLALFDAQRASKIDLPDRDAIIAALRTTWSQVDAAQDAFDLAAADAARKGAADKDAATKLAAATKNAVANKLAAINEIIPKHSLVAV